jgi:hypothetical protein
VATGTAEGSPRWVVVVGSAASGATSVVPLLLGLVVILVWVTLAGG